MPVRATQVFALLGHPVDGNPTQEMVESALAVAGIDATYVSLDVLPDDLEEAMHGVRALGFRGLHITVPHKVAVVPLVDRLTAAAQICGAVNCVKREGNTLVGDNTDGRGFLVSIREVLEPSGLRAVVFGAGGAARAVVAELALAGVGRLSIVNRSLRPAAEIAERVAAATGVHCDAIELREPWAIPAGADVIVQATSLGMADEHARLPLEWSATQPHAVAADVVIAPPRTAFLNEAEAHGLRTIAGVSMLVAQAAIGFRWWFDRDPDTGAMREAVARTLGSA